MGKSYVSLIKNGANRFILKKAYDLLKRKEVIESSEINNFSRDNRWQNHKFPKFNDVIDIEIGVDGTKTSIVRLRNNHYIVFKGVINFNTLLKYDIKNSRYNDNNDLKFQSLSQLKNYILKTKSIPDYFILKNIPYRIENYDSDGEYLNWRNKKTTNGIYMYTSNRYNSYRDIKLELIKNEGIWRRDFED